jgi:hypothetical protein
VVGLANGSDLLEVMSAVDQMESAPLVDVEGAEDGVCGALAPRAEESFRFVEDEIEAG